MDTNLILSGIAVAIGAVILVVLLLPKKRQEDVSQQKAFEELSRLKELLGQLELKFTQVLLEQIGDVKVKFVESLSATMNETSKTVRGDLDALSLAVQNNIDSASRRIAGTDANMQTRFDELRKQIQTSITDTTKAVDGRLGDTTKRLDDRMGSTTSALDIRIGELSKAIDSRITGISQSIDTRLQSAQQTQDEVQKRLAELKSATDKMVDIGTDIKALQDVWSPPKLRGEFGEVLLEHLLAEILPQELWERQYRLSGGIVDAIIRLPGGIVPVDSKFPVDSFVRIAKAADEKGRLDAQKQFAKDVRAKIDETAGYIAPSEGTFDFALMFIPGENVYYELMSNPSITAKDDVLTYARSKRVVPVSPQVFYAYMQTILLGLRGMKVEENARMIIDKLSTLKIELDRIYDSYRKADNQLRHARTNFDEVSGELDRMASLVSQLEAIGSGRGGEN